MLAKSVISASKSVMLKNALPAIQVAYFSRSLGQVKWFDTKKGFGFIAASTGEDLFVHQSAIKSDGFRALTRKSLLFVLKFFCNRVTVIFLS